jgi:hypothetical protein
MTPDARAQLAMIGIAMSVLLVTPPAAADDRPGHTGGIIGQQDKSVSGVSQAPAKPRIPARKPAPMAHSEDKGLLQSFAGAWLWQAKCGDGRIFDGRLKLEQDAPGILSGACSSEDIRCGAISGHTKGKNATLAIWWADPLGGHRTQIDLSLLEGGKRMQGAEESVTMGTCTWQVTRQ